MGISHCYCSDYMTKPTQFGDEPYFFGKLPYSGQHTSGIGMCLFGDSFEANFTSRVLSSTSFS